MAIGLATIIYLVYQVHYVDVAQQGTQAEPTATQQYRYSSREVGGVCGITTPAVVYRQIKTHSAFPAVGG